MLRKFGLGLFLFLFIAPFGYLLYALPSIKMIDATELQWAVMNSTKQALLSALLGLGFGVWIAMGLNRLELHRAWWGQTARMLLLLPSLMPPFFVLLTFLSWVQPFPFGILGIVLIQFPMMAGFSGVILQRQMNDKLGQLAMVAQVMGASRLLFWQKAWGVFRRELASLFGFLFIWGFTSFSIPFVVGGGRGTTLEILIYEKVRISADWGAALSLSLIQSILIAALLFIVPTAKGKVALTESAPLLRSRVGLGFVVLFCGLFLVPWIFLSWSGWGFVFSSEGFLQQVVFASLASVRNGMLVSLMMLLSLMIFAYGFAVSWFQRFFQVYFAPSISLLGLAGLGFSSALIDLDPGLFLMNAGRSLENFVYAFLLLVMFAPLLFRLGLDSLLSDLEEQIQVARTMGASHYHIYVSVVLPQLWPRLCLMAGLSALWSVGDFGLAKFFFDSGETLPLLIENLMGSYRIDPALSLGHLVFAFGALFFFIYWRLSHVFDSRPKRQDR